MTQESEENNGEIHDEVLTDVDFPDEKGTVYAVRRVEQGSRRIDWKIGHIKGTYAEAIDLYHNGEELDINPLEKIPENGPSGRYKDSTFHELLDAEMNIEDGKIISKKVHDLDGIDAVEWAAGKAEGAFMAETILDEWWVEPSSAGSSNE